MKKKDEKTREQLKKGILDCVNDIESNIEPILDRLMARCCKAYFTINIEPGSIISYTEYHEHFPVNEAVGCDWREEKHNGKTNKL